MGEKIRGRLFLTDSEREVVFRLVDKLMYEDVTTMEEALENESLAQVLIRLVYGKRIPGQETSFFPITLVKTEDKE
jgi:hypothetical protein